MWKRIATLFFVQSVLTAAGAQNYSCGEASIRGTSGFIESPNYPNNYPDNASCTWSLKASPGYKFYLTRLDFDLEPGNSWQVCKYDYLEVFGDYTRTLQRYCGTNFPASVLSSGTSLKLSFRSDVNVTRSGFRIRWETMSTTCGGTISATSSGLIASPGYPSSYNSNARCTWRINGPAASVIRLSFVVMHVEAGGVNVCHDYVQVYDGETKSLGRYCGGTSSPSDTHTLQSTGKLMKLYFYSDHSLTKKGFIVRYEVTGGAIRTAHLTFVSLLGSIVLMITLAY